MKKSKSAIDVRTQTTHCLLRAFIAMELALVGMGYTTIVGLAMASVGTRVLRFQSHLAGSKSSSKSSCLGGSGVGMPHVPASES